MIEYGFEDIIINPEDPRLEGAIGKECYFSDYPKQLLNGARNNSPEYLDYLTDIRKEAACTFVDKNGSGWILIIIKKEEPKPEYKPFKNFEEFLGAHSCVNTDNLDRVHRYLDSHGIWLKEKGSDDSDTFCIVHELCKYGVFVGHADVFISEGTACTDFASWYDLYMGYTFLDGTPCGKLMEEDND